MIRKKILISKFMTSQSGEQSIAIHVLPNISRIKGNHAMKSGQLIEYHMRNIFLENSYTERVGETIPMHIPILFPKNQICIYVWVRSLKFYTVCFYFMSSWGLSKHIETKLETCFYLI